MSKNKGKIVLKPIYLTMKPESHKSTMGSEHYNVEYQMGVLYLADVSEGE